MLREDIVEQQNLEILSLLRRLVVAFKPEHAVNGGVLCSWCSSDGHFPECPWLAAKRYLDPLEDYSIRVEELGWPEEENNPGPPHDSWAERS